MGQRIVMVGAGAVGGYVGGHLAMTGADVRADCASNCLATWLLRSQMHPATSAGTPAVATICRAMKLTADPIDLPDVRCSTGPDSFWFWSRVQLVA